MNKKPCHECGLFVCHPLCPLGDDTPPPDEPHCDPDYTLEWDDDDGPIDPRFDPPCPY